MRKHLVTVYFISLFVILAATAGWVKQPEFPEWYRQHESLASKGILIFAGIYFALGLMMSFMGWLPRYQTCRDTMGEDASFFSVFSASLDCDTGFDGDCGGDGGGD